MLDSSPVALPPIPRPLKRSASTASLPTPPRTHHKRNRRAKRREYDTESSASEEGSHSPGVSDNYKKRKLATGSADGAQEEEAFWMNKSDGDCPDTEPIVPPSAPATSLSSSPAQPPALLYRRRHVTASASTSSVGTAPVSPPPSNRKPSAAIKAIVATSAPVTPERKKRSRGFPIRDSPNNPFLLSPDVPTAEDSASPSPDPSPHTPVHLQERPTVTYVFRGVRGTFPNPLYDHEHKRPRSPSARSKLPAEHPDFSPDPSCPPKLLFPAAPRKSKRQPVKMVNSRTMEHAAGVAPLEFQSAPKTEGRMLKIGKMGASRSGGESDDEADDDDEDLVRIQPIKLDFKPGAKR